MRNFYKYSFVFILMLSIFSCKKTIQDSDQDAITMPYALFFGTKSGAVWNTNDGVHFRQYFSNDGSPVTAICSAKTNMVYGKLNLYVNKNNEPTNNLAYNSINNISCKFYSYLVYDSIYLSNSICYNSDNNIVYTCANNSFPLLYSKDSGSSYKIYGGKSNIDSTLSHFPEAAMAVVEFNKEGTYFIDDESRIFYQYSKSFANGGSQDEYWRSCSSNLSTSNFEIWRLAKYNGKLVAYDVRGYSGIQVSNTAVSGSGTPLSLNFSPISLYFSNAPILTINSLDKNMYIGTLRDGLYKYDGSVVKHCTSDIPKDAIVYDIAIKQNVFRSGNIGTYVYVATNTGLYKSDDHGESFTKIYDGIISSVE